MTPPRLLAAHVAVAIRVYRQRLRAEYADVPPELELLERLAVQASRPDSDRQEPPEVDGPGDGAHGQPMMLTIAQAARELACSPRTVERLIESDALASVKIAGARRIPRDSLDRLGGRS